MHFCPDRDRVRLRLSTSSRGLSSPKYAYLEPFGQHQAQEKMNEPQQCASFKAFKYDAKCRDYMHRKAFYLHVHHVIIESFVLDVL